MERMKAVKKSMKFRLLISLILLSCLAGPVFSASSETGRVNYYADMMDDTYYASLCRYVFDDHGISGLMDEFKALEQGIESSHYEQWKKDASIGRAALIAAKYANDSDDKELARTLMQIADERIAKAKGEGAPVSATGVLEALSTSFWYLVDGSLSKGMKFPGMVDDLYDEYPEDFHVLLLEAERYLNSPGIVGGNKRKGLNLFKDAEEVMLEMGASPWDQYTIYCGLAKGYDARDKEKEAKKYASLAMDIYSAGDEDVEEILD